MNIQKHPHTGWEAPAKNNSSITRTISQKAKLIPQQIDSEKEGQRTQDTSRKSSNSYQTITFSPKEEAKTPSNSTKSFTPNQTKPEEAHISNNNGWALPLKKPNKTDPSNKLAPSKVTVVKSEPRTTLKQERELQERLEKIMAGSEFQQFVTFSEENAHERQRIPPYESVIPSKLSQEEIEQKYPKKIVCQNYKVNYLDKSEPIFGYPLLVKSDRNGKYIPLIIFEFLSFAAVANSLKDEISEPGDEYKLKRYTTKKGVEYNYWLPLAINDEHFAACKERIQNVIARIHSGKESLNKFEPRMILDVFVPLLAEIGAQLGEDYKSSQIIQGFIQVFFLVKKLISTYPALENAVHCNPDAILMEQSLKLNEKIVKLLLSGNDLASSEVSFKLLKEFLAINAPQQLKDGITSVKETSPNFLWNLMLNLMEASKSVVVLRQLAILLQDNGVEEELENRYGFVDEARLKVFTSRLDKILINEDSKFIDWRLFIEGFGAGKSVQKFRDLLRLVLHSTSL